jgi:electron transfer flavoprotein beta subunit
VLSIQTGINEPRYVGMRGIRQVASVPIPSFGAAELDIEPGTVGLAAAKVRRMDYFVPALGKGADVLKGSREQNVAELIGMLKAQGGLQ